MARQAGTGPTVRPIAHLSLVDRVADELHRAILNGDIKPGAAVSIVELCEQFDVSHIPVREALRRLESEGLVSLRPGRSALVAALSPEDLADIYRLRRVIEGDLTMRAMAQMTEERLEQAQVALDEYAELERQPSALAATHHAFHAAILDDVTGPVDRRVLEILWHSGNRYLHLLMDDLERATETTQARINEHRALLDLARDGRVQDFHDAWIAHLDSSEEALRLALERHLESSEAVPGAPGALDPSVTGRNGESALSHL